MKDKLGFYTFIFGFFGFFLAFAVFLATDLIRDVERGKVSVHWPATSGEVVDIFRTQTRPVVEYRYTVDERTYTSSRAAFVRRRSLQAGSGLGPYYGRDFTEGESVQVYYDPVDPGVAVLIPGAPLSGILVESLVGIFLFLIGGGGVWLGLKSPPWKTTQSNERQAA